jgi:hypothetical protein
MAESIYFGGADATITVDGQTLAVVKGYGANIRFDHNELYGMDSIKRVAIAKFKCRVECNFKWVKFDPTLGSWFIYDVLNPGGTASPGAIEDTSCEYYLDINFAIAPFCNAEGTPLQLTVSDAYLIGVPFGLAENDWVTLDVKALGKTAAFT